VTINPQKPLSTMSSATKKRKSSADSKPDKKPRSKGARLISVYKTATEQEVLHEPVSDQEQFFKDFESTAVLVDVSVEPRSYARLVQGLIARNLLHATFRLSGKSEITFVYSSWPRGEIESHCGSLTFEVKLVRDGQEVFSGKPFASYEDAKHLKTYEQQKQFGKTVTQKNMKTIFGDDTIKKLTEIKLSPSTVLGKLAERLFQRVWWAALDRKKKTAAEGAKTQERNEAEVFYQVAELLKDLKIFASLYYR